MVGVGVGAFTVGIHSRLYTKNTRAHTYKELIREWLRKPKGSIHSSYMYIVGR